MIEAGANEIPEAKMIEAIYMAHDINQTIIEFIDKIVAEVGKEKHTYVSCAVPAEMFEAMKKIVTPEQMEEAVFTDDKQTREKNIDEVTEKMEEAFADNEEWLAVLGEAVYQYQKKTVRKMISKTIRDRMDVLSTRFVHCQQKLILFREYMVLLCLQEDRHRFVTL